MSRFTRITPPKIDVYLAVPYTHKEDAVQQWRYERVTEATAVLIRNGYCDCVYSPITHSHPIDKHLCKRADHDFWVDKFDLPFLLNSQELVVLMLPGWDKSEGIAREINQARAASIPVTYMRPVYDEIFRVIDMEEVTPAELVEGV